MSMQYLFTALSKIIRCLFLVAAIVALTALPARAVVLKVTLSDVVLHVLGLDFPTSGSFIYDPAENKILSGDIYSEASWVGSFGDSDTIMRTSYADYTPWPSFSFIDIYFWPQWAYDLGIYPPEDSCNDWDHIGGYSFLCLISSEPITKPGQHVELAGSFGGPISFGGSNDNDSGYLTGWLHTRAAGGPYQRIPEPTLISAMLFAVYGFIIYMIRSRRPSAQETPVV